MGMHPNRHLPIDGTFNIRDLGGYSAGAAETLWRRILRADGLHRITEAGRDTLVSEGVRTVIDLRRPAELEAQPNPFAADTRVRYVNVSLFENLAPTYGPQIDTLHALYVRALEERMEVIASILTVIAEAEAGAVLFHCTAGKDRTGLIAALLLVNAGVADDDIIADYALTGRMIAPLLEDILAHAAEQGMDEEAMRPLLACAPETMRATLAHIGERHGSIAHYLNALGLGDAVAGRLKSKLTGDAQ
ncbi:tyrosine-protein phosphatase [Rhizobium sp. C4]|uniref:tyrosine-protein phosphatase n=1 Tax=Rhizobium sp. C4 TaxID=1349800 RepID=UPI001E31F8ED|nr:tyrosine-protein phosphatase [Rhizobium sp. C4]MCD2172096.1 tyrosine-protein phosphatase [Rhizobium sp. C4]